ncbi:MAG: family 10 glycosylhydrolase, partial [Myxococcota bacterium]|nr:family 10 glycosylhydrolase [Myxococcota bacterium]
MLYAMRLLLVLLLSTACVAPPKVGTGPVEGLESEVPASQDPVMVEMEGPPTELRGIWITRWSYHSADEIVEILDKVADAGFNTVFLQVRGVFDAYYESRYEPWAARLSGTLGRHPGWDPLKVAIEAAKSRDLKIHAYINAATLWSGLRWPGQTDPLHALRVHPDWRVVRDSGHPMELSEGYVFASPGVPEVRQRLANVASDIADRYEVDGIHLDYIRFPGLKFASGEKWDQEQERAEWREEQVTEMIRGVSDVIDVPLSAAVWGINDNQWGWSGVSEGAADFGQNSREIMAQGVLDASIPMIYWPVADVPGERLDFRTLVQY